MAKQIQLRRGTTAENNAFKGALGEVTVDTTSKQLRLHDNSKVGGFKIPTYDDSQGVESLGYAGKAKVLTAGNLATQKYLTGWYTLAAAYTNAPVVESMTGLMLVSVRAYGTGSALIFQVFNNSSADYYVGQSPYTTNSDGTVTPSSDISWKEVAYMGDVNLKLDTTSAFGVGQTWQNMTGSRALGTTYTNSTNKTIVAYISGYGEAGATRSGTINGNVVQSFSGLSSGLTSTVALFIPVNGTYSVNGAIDSWWELR